MDPLKGLSCDYRIRVPMGQEKVKKKKKKFFKSQEKVRKFWNFVKHQKQVRKNEIKVHDISSKI